MENLKETIPSDEVELSFWLWEQFQNALDKDPLLVGTSLAVFGQALHMASPYAKTGGLSPGHRVQYVGVGLMSISAGDDAILGTVADVTGISLIMAGITNTDMWEKFATAIGQDPSDQTEPSDQQHKLLWKILSPFSKQNVQNTVDKFN